MYNAAFFVFLDMQEALKPHEKRAINFLVNEYLLQTDYRLASVTFSDENADQVRSIGKGEETILT